MTVKFKAVRFLENEPVTVKLSETPDLECNAVSVFGRLFPAQIEDGVLTVILSVPPGEYELNLTKSEKMKPIAIEEGEDKLNVLIDGKFFTSYVYTDKLYKPYLGPVMTSFGESFTRLDFETKEHPHHRSVFFGVGDVTLEGDGAPANVDFWNEPENCGIQRHVGIEKTVVGTAFSSFTAKTVWCSHEGTPMIDASTEYKFYNQSEGCRYVDVAITYKASYGKVDFGPTKEAGPLGVRMADPLRVDAGGYMENSYGAVGEKECWGKAANWCVYGGKLAGKDIGIAVFDNEKNERYPATWHIRNYGLFAANNLYFRGGLTIPAGEKLIYRYRLVFFEGSVRAKAPGGRGTFDNVHVKERFISYCR